MTAIWMREEVVPVLLDDLAEVVAPDEVLLVVDVPPVVAVALVAPPPKKSFSCADGTWI